MHGWACESGVGGWGSKGSLLYVHSSTFVKGALHWLQHIQFCTYVRLESKFYDEEKQELTRRARPTPRRSCRPLQLAMSDSEPDQVPSEASEV